MPAAARTVYLNNAATAWPLAPGVVEAVTQTLQNPPVEPGRSSSSGDAPLSECRSRLAALMQVQPPEQIVLGPGATHALNLLLLGFDWKAGDRIVTTVTEHNSVLRPLHHLRRRHGIELVFIGVDSAGQLDAEAAEAAVADRARMIVLNHISNVTGLVNPVARLFQSARNAGVITVLDASQSLGCVPVLPRPLSADAVVFTGHKGLRAPAGTGGLYLRPGLELEPVLVGGTGVRSDLEFQPPEMPMRLEAGTPNTAAFAGLAAALRWLDGHGEAFQQRQQRAIHWLAEGLREVPRVKVFGESAAGNHAGPVSFRIAGWPVLEAGEALRESFGIICRTGLHCAPLIHAPLGSLPEGTIRFSPSGFTTDAEVESTLEAVRQLAA